MTKDTEAVEIKLHYNLASSELQKKSEMHVDSEDVHHHVSVCLPRCIVGMICSIFCFFFLIEKLFMSFTVRLNQILDQK